MRVALFGGAGYIGSHVAVALLQAGIEADVFDDLSNGSMTAVERAASLGGGRLRLFRGDITQRGEIEQFFNSARFDAVIILAGLKSVTESVCDPAGYYATNVGGCANILKISAAYGIGDIIFSSSATVYGEFASAPVREDASLDPSTPYGRTKLVCEWLVADHVSAIGGRAFNLRYFNPVGAHPSGEIGESPSGQPTNLFPVIGLVASGRLPELSIFGCDFPTADGSAVRDFIHVMDLADAHLAAINSLGMIAEGQVKAVNVGTGSGTTVLSAVQMWEQVLGRQIPINVTSRRPGDIAVSFTDPSFARTVLGWEAKKGLHEMVSDQWNWLQRSSMEHNPLP